MQPRTMIGVGIGGLSLALLAVVGCWFLSYSTGDVRSAARSSQSQDHLHNLMIGLHDYESGNDQFLAAATFNAAVPPVETHSWQTHMLPYVFHAHVHSGIDQRVPWDDPVNLPPLSAEVDVYLNPGIGSGTHDASGRAITHYAGNSRILVRGTPLTFRDVKDGASNTLFSGEISTSFTAWGQPPNTRDPAVGLHKTPLSFGGPWANGATNFSFLDGRVQKLSAEIDPAVLRAISTPAGGESVHFP